MTDTIFITGVVIHARHGVMEHETEVGQRFVIDLELFTDLSESSHTDRLSDTVSYSNVVATATAAFKNTNYKLLERAAGAVADAILAAFPRIRTTRRMTFTSTANSTFRETAAREPEIPLQISC